MKTVILLSLLGSALAHPKGLWWGTDLCYPSPEKADNYCLSHQKTGFDWNELANGDNWGYEGFEFVGFSHSDACGASGGKCIEAKLSRDDGYAVRMEATQAPFTVQKFHLSTSRDTTVRINYEMPDGSFCHQIASSTQEGADVINQQCGGAAAVEFTLPEDSKFGECDLNIHQIDFDCSSEEKPPGPLHTPSASSSQPSYSTPAHTSATAIIVSSSSFVTPSPSSVWTHPAITSGVSYTRPDVVTLWTTEEITVTSCAPTVTDCPPHSTVTSTHITSNTVWPSSSNVIQSSITSASPSSTPIVPAPCPEVVPKCINTWLGVPKCDSNSDAACFCPSSEFTHKVEGCIDAWGSSDEEKSSALSYFAGICAPYIPQNPDVISLVPVASTTPTVPAQVPNSAFQSPVTSISQASQTPCTTITWSSQTVTVPQVVFTTVSTHSTTSVALIAPPVTPAAPISSTTTCSSFHTLPTTKATTGPPAKPTETTVLSNEGWRPLPLQNLLSAGVAVIFVFFV